MPGIWPEIARHTSRNDRSLNTMPTLSKSSGLIGNGTTNVYADTAARGGGRAPCDSGERRREGPRAPPANQTEARTPESAPTGGGTLGHAARANGGQHCGGRGGQPRPISTGGMRPDLRTASGHPSLRRPTEGPRRAPHPGPPPDALRNPQRLAQGPGAGQFSGWQAGDTNMRRPLKTTLTKWLRKDRTRVRRAGPALKWLDMPGARCESMSATPRGSV